MECRRGLRITALTGIMGQNGKVENEDSNSQSLRGVEDIYTIANSVTPQRNQEYPSVPLLSLKNSIVLRCMSEAGPTLPPTLLAVTVVKAEAGVVVT